MFIEQIFLTHFKNQTKDNNYRIICIVKNTKIENKRFFLDSYFSKTKKLLKISYIKLSKDIEKSMSFSFLLITS